MKKSFCLNYFCLAFVFISITFLTGCFSTPESTLQELKKAVDNKDVNKIWSLLSSKDHKFYKQAIDYCCLDKKKIRSGKQFFIEVLLDEINDSGNIGKPLEIESVKVSKNKAVIFVKDNPSGFTLVKEFGSWKVFIAEEDIISIIDFFSTPQYKLNELKKAIDSKDGYKMSNLLSSDDKKYYEKMIEDEKIISLENIDNVKNEKLTPKELIKKREDALFVKMIKNVSDLQNTGKELKIKSFTKKSEEKVVASLEDNPNGITFVKEQGIWKISIFRRTVKLDK